MGSAHARWLPFHRPIGSYSKIQRLYGNLIRNRSFQAWKQSVKNKRLLNVGCGDQRHAAFINIDYNWLPGLDLCWDIRKPLPFADGSIQGVFTEHCLEHLSFSAANSFFADIFRILEPGGVVRIIVPDAELFLRAYSESRDSGLAQFPKPYGHTLPNDAVCPMMVVNSIFRDFGHLYAYDFECLHRLLTHHSFSTIRRCTFRRGASQQLLIDSEARREESLYVEAVK